MKNSHKEVLLIAQEECAEVTQAISKVFRFGLDMEHNGRTNRQHLTEEIGDLLCMIDLIVEAKMIDRVEMLNASAKKRQKLLKWSNVFNDETDTELSQV